MKESIKGFLQNWLGEYYVLLRDIFHVIVPFLSPYNRLFWLYLVAFLAVAFVIYARQERRGISGGRFLAFVFPKSVYLDPSALLTIRYYFVNGVVVSVIRFSAIILTATQFSIWISSAMEGAFGPNQGAPVGAMAMVGFSLAIIAARDFADYSVHHLFHRIPILWEFHKVHHCPEQITPFTNEQTHPVETIARGLVGAILGGIVIGLVNYLYLESLQEFTILEVGIVFFAFSLLANFRHSHIWLPFPQWLSWVLSSPAMHQIHHSKALDHWDKNYAVIFSFWDWLFGTIYIPKHKENLSLGLANDPPSDYDSLLKLYWGPFGRIYKSVATRAKLDTKPHQSP